MTKDEVLRLAIEADLVEPRDIDNDVCKLPEDYVASLVAFAALVAAHEREECAKVCEAIYNDPEENNGYDAYYTRPYLECAEVIRARGQE